MTVFIATYYNHSTKKEETQEYTANNYAEAYKLAFNKDAKALAEKRDFSGVLSLSRVNEYLPNQNRRMR